jgi:ribosomal protein S18 acetylase RimI-like enzyme
MDTLPETNIFMMCERLNRAAFSPLPAGYHARTCRPDELAIWKAMPFDDPATAAAYEPFMTEFFATTYGGREELFFASTLFVCDASDRPAATCGLWRAYDAITTVHWLKVVREHEGHGLGRAILSLVLGSLGEEGYPVYLHTQPESVRAIKLYSDFGFHLLAGEKFGSRRNHLAEGLEYLRRHMPEAELQKLQVSDPPQHLLDVLDRATTIQF